MAGVCAALAAARHGATVALMHDRPMFGGNASSECRVHICGADRHNRIKHLRETGILEEIRMENLHRNPQRSFGVWDTILYEKIMAEENIIPLLNCSCLNADIDDSKINSVTGWQLTTETYQRVEARIFVDCSGDGILAPLSNADFRMGREARDEFNESIAPEKADSKTMGMTCLFHARKHSTEQPFKPLPWAYTYRACEELPYGFNAHKWIEMGYWWIEYGGEKDSIHDTEKIRDELLKITYGVWDHLKNHCAAKENTKNWAVDWIQFLPAKRESRRFVGAHVLTQNDIENDTQFDDCVAYGGWEMDDHHPAGFYAVKKSKPATIFHNAPSPFHIPYRSLYSRNVRNLMFAGRNASCTHAAMSSTRVMGTASSMGQAAGTAAAMAVQKDILPADLLAHIKELQRELMRDDAYLPALKMTFPTCINDATLTASQNNPEPVRDGFHRQIGDNPHCWICSPGDWIEYSFPTSVYVSSVTLVLASGMDQRVALSYHQNDSQLTSMPDVMPKQFQLEINADGEWKQWIHEEENHQRLCRYELHEKITGLRFTLNETYGAETSRVYGFYAE